MTAGYSGTPLPRKLGIREKTRLTILHAPGGFKETLGPLPPGVVTMGKITGQADVVVLFLKAFKTLESEFTRAAAMLPPAGGMLWIAWPKNAAKMKTDLDENLIRDFGLAAGLVDTKVCAIDETWSGLRFSRRRSA